MEGGPRDDVARVETRRIDFHYLTFHTLPPPPPTWLALPPCYICTVTAFPSLGCDYQAFPFRTVLPDLRRWQLLYV